MVLLREIGAEHPLIIRLSEERGKRGWWRCAVLNLSAQGTARGDETLTQSTHGCSRSYQYWKWCLSYEGIVWPLTLEVRHNSGTETVGWILKKHQTKKKNKNLSLEATHLKGCLAYGLYPQGCPILLLRGVKMSRGRFCPGANPTAAPTPLSEKEPKIPWINATVTRQSTQ